MNDKIFSERAFDRAAADLRRIVHVIAARHKLRGGALTWRVLHDIEAEALSDLGLQGRHAEVLLALFARPADCDYPYSDEPVRVSAANPPLLARLVLDAYGMARPATAPRYGAARLAAASALARMSSLQPI
jgi:hypothetical protein